MKNTGYDADEDLLLDSAQQAGSLERHLNILRAERRYHRMAYGVMVAFLMLEIVLLIAGYDLEGHLAATMIGLPLLLAHHHHAQARCLLRQIQTVRLVQAEGSLAESSREPLPEVTVA